MLVMALRSADSRSFADMVMDCAFLVVSASASHLSLLLLVSDCASAYGRVALAFRPENVDTIVLHCLSPSPSHTCPKCFDSCVP